MAISQKGNDGFIGKTGNTVVYLLNGKLVKREIGFSSKAPTDLQLANWQITRVVSHFLGPIKDFVNVGFSQEAKVAKKSAYNMATSFNRSNAIIGDYPDQKIDFSKVLVSRGKIPPTVQVGVELTADGLLFTWDTLVTDSGRKWNDQVMLMAYMPQLKEAVYLINGDIRTVGSDLLRLPKFTKEVVIETYISFIAANHKNVSDSIYTGEVIWKHA